MTIDDIRPYPDNAKEHLDDQVDKIANSLRVFGWQQPIVVDTEGVIIVGHGRYIAYMKYRDTLPEPWIKIADGLTPEQVIAYRLADNKLNESTWNIDLVYEQLKLLPNDLQLLTGFDPKLGEFNPAMPDEVPKLDEKGKTTCPECGAEF
jgi:ParB family chromosome partitioning protein